MNPSLLRILLRLILLYFVMRVLVPIFRSAGRAFKGLFSSQASPKQKRESEGHYSNLTPYEIEDADYEEIREKKEQG